MITVTELHEALGKLNTANHMAAGKDWLVDCQPGHMGEPGLFVISTADDQRVKEYRTLDEVIAYLEGQGCANPRDQRKEP